MKKLLFLFIILLYTPALSWGQIDALQAEKEKDFALTAEAVTYYEVIKMEGAKMDLYSKAREWYVTTFNDANEVIQMEDKQSGKIIGKGYAEFMTSGDAWATLGAMGDVVQLSQLRFTIRTYFKDGKTKIVFDDMEVIKTQDGKIINTRTLSSYFFKKSGKRRTGRKSLQNSVLDIINNTVSSYKKALANTEDETW